MEPSEWGIGRLFDHMADAVVVANAATEQIILWNRGAADLFGYSAEQAKAMPLHALVPPQLRDAHRRAIARYAASGEGAVIDAQAPIEVSALRSNGVQVPVELRLSRIDNPPGVEGRHVLAIIRDATDRTAAEEYRRRLAVREARRMDALEIHDDIVQALATAKMAFELGDAVRAEAAVEAALVEARALVAARLDDLFDDEGEMQPGALRRRLPPGS
ncbi:MAG: PAS domain S-box protein [Acidimicrobiia bacterium]|nr:PAS domain S-box protein [Acidimicrobiia bacterium]